MKKIGIDARMYGPKHGGIGRYVAQIIQEYFAYNSELQLVLFMTPEGRKEINHVPDWVNIIEVDIPWYGVKEQLFFSRIIEKSGVEMMHFPHWNVPLAYKGKFVVTIHDLIMFHFSRKEATTRSMATYWIKDSIHRKVVASAIDRATTILVPSNFTKQDIVQTFDVATEKIVVTYEGVTKFPSHRQSLSSELQQKRYMLYVGSAYPHKNLHKLVSAWELYAEDYPNDLLVIAGKDDRFFSALELKIQEMGVTNVVLKKGEPDEAIASLYASAHAFSFLSLYEGFGLPPLEAMQYQIPVLASNRSCMPEILGEAAYFVDPEDEGAIVDGINTIMNNDSVRDALKEASYTEIKRYTWKSCAQNTWQEYLKSK